MAFSLSMRTLIKRLSEVLSLFGVYKKPDVSVLMYHRVGSGSKEEMDVSLDVFDKQMEVLSSSCVVLTLHDMISYLRDPYPKDDLMVLLTFDDGYEDFYSNVLPILEKYHLPAILFLQVGFVDGSCYPVRNGNLRMDQKPLTKMQLEEIALNDLVEIGCHTYSHDLLVRCSDAYISTDIELANDYLFSLTGKPVESFAYPKGVWDSRVELVVKKYFNNIFLVGGGGVCLSRGVDMHRIPRIPILKSDGMRFFYSRIYGRLWLEELVSLAYKKIKYNWLS